MSLSAPSYVSPTTGSDQNDASAGDARAAWATSASRTTPTEWVFVMAMTPPSMPDSRTHSRPVSSPLPLSRWQPAKTGSVQTSSAWGTTTVTPVRTGPCPTTSGPSPSMSVVWPTRTPGTSVIASCSPGFEQADPKPQLASAHGPSGRTRPPLARRPLSSPGARFREAGPARGRCARRRPPLRLPALDGVAPMDAAEAFRDLPGLALLESARPGPHRPLELPDRRSGRGARRPAEGPDPFAEARALLARLDGGAAVAAKPQQSSARRRPGPPSPAASSATSATTSAGGSSACHRSRAWTSTCRSCASRSTTGRSGGTAARAGVARRAGRRR